MDFILEPWAWYVSGFLIALVMFLLMMMGDRFGLSSNLRTLCTICGAGKKTDFFSFDWKSQKWNLLVMIGAVIGGFIGAHFLSNNTGVNISSDTIEQLQEIGINSSNTSYLPTEIFGLFTFKNILLLAVGGFMVGFGARYAGGCTSGHAISGLSNLQIPSLIAVIGFFIGGLFMIHVLFPFIF
ncbi:YeeE/YedE thiosulfate transporter family protein [Wenyingzhuangia sp. chi5]|uniref:YeeE/YedE thiosulfate transporter family protein n=1 Tax=Wenyingzhuangia gilva TaxID=3057677 RepID=A0ABT8VU75_9FLAO|nr:YeeE/YedE thiosulfate transporter family protein [Wenyingzhuangia sp. chi5]MDO3695523.1 YeeE/YedE thiosulfate transporter family protein [Wenyingzhuangia sp. chi5]